MNEDLIGIRTLMIIFGIILIAVGCYFYTGHKNEFLFGRARASVKNMTKDDVKKVGKIVIIIGTVIEIVGLGLLLIKI